jgi:hypothetical protein
MRVGNSCSAEKAIGHFDERDYLLEHAAFSHYVKGFRTGTMRSGRWKIGDCARMSATSGYRVKGQDAVFEPEQHHGCRS